MNSAVNIAAIRMRKLHVTHVTGKGFGSGVQIHVRLQCFLSRKCFFTQTALESGMYIHVRMDFSAIISGIGTNLAQKSFSICISQKKIIDESLGPFSCFHKFRHSWK